MEKINVSCLVTHDAEAEADAGTRLGICPYYKKERGGGHMNCEGATFRFPDRLARREYVYRFCAHPEGYQQCPLKIAIDHFYERKYAHDE